MFDLASMIRRAGLCTFALSLAMCTESGTETDNPIVFEATECKSHATALTLPSTVASTRPALDVDASAYDALYCYAWEAGDDGALTIDVLNYSSGCSITWELGEGKVSGDQIDLGLSMKNCAIASCGSCVYDFTFEVQAVDTSAPVGVQLRRLACGDGEDEVGPRVALPLDSSASGILCRPQHRFGFEDACGEPHKRTCQGEEPACNEGLVIADHESDEAEACFTSCEVDADCPLEVESCQDGACRLRETF